VAYERVNFTFIYIYIYVLHSTKLNSLFVLICFLLGTNKSLGAIPDGIFPTRVLSWLTWLVTDLFPRRTRFDPTSVHVWFVVDKVALGEGFVLVLGFPLSLSSHLCSRLIFIETLFLSEGEDGYRSILRGKTVHA